MHHRNEFDSSAVALAANVPAANEATTPAADGTSAGKKKNNGETATGPEKDNGETVGLVPIPLGQGLNPPVNIMYSFKVQWAQHISHSFVVQKFDELKTACDSAGVSYISQNHVRALSRRHPSMCFYPCFLF